MKKSRIVFFGVLSLLLPGKMIAQNYQIQKIIINFVDMDVSYPFSIDSITFRTLDYRSTCIDDHECLIMFQDCLDKITQDKPEYKHLDIRRELTVIYSDCNIVKLYVDNFHFLYNGTIYLYDGVMRKIIEDKINSYKPNNSEY